MAKTYVDTVKYVIYAHAEMDGIIEKPDVVGALFGQTEGLLGDELDLRELQKSGRIGRIEVDLKNQGGKSIGRVILPSSLDRVETAILGAALETVDRVGPCEARIHVERIEDTRTMKRSQVIDRAKTLLKTMMTDVLPESKELSELVRDEVKTAEINYYGPEKLPCGPNIASADHIIIVEGRADVLTMLKCDIENVISLMGKNIPKAAIDLSKQKTVTVFVDGDRGGDLIVKQMAELAEADFVAKAPDGKEVEELTKKEIIKCLRNKIPIEQFLSRTFRDNGERRFTKTFEKPFEKVGEKIGEKPAAPKEKEIPKEVKPIPFQNILRELSGSLKGALLSEDGRVIVETDVRELVKEIENHAQIHAIVFDGIITQRLVDLANEKKTKYLAGMRTTRVDNKGLVEIITIS
jgi:DNA primase